MFALTVTSLLWRHEVSNLSGGFEGDLPCWRCVFLWRLVWLLSMPHLQTVLRHLHTRTHTHILWSFLMPVTPKLPPLTVSIYLLYKKTLSCINYWLNYSNYDASAWPELSFGNLYILSVLTTLFPKSVRKWGWGESTFPQCRVGFFFLFFFMGFCCFISRKVFLQRVYFSSCGAAFSFPYEKSALMQHYCRTSLAIKHNC